MDYKNMTKIETFNKKQTKELPDLKTGYTVRINSKIKEGDKERIQAFEGLIIAIKHGKGISGTITVRKISHGVGVERVFPIHSPQIDSIEIIKKSKVRRAKLYYIRKKSKKESRLRDISDAKKAKFKKEKQIEVPGEKESTSVISEPEQIEKEN